MSGNDDDDGLFVVDSETPPAIVPPPSPQPNASKSKQPKRDVESGETSAPKDISTVMKTSAAQELDDVDDTRRLLHRDTRPDSTGLDWKNIHKNTVVQSNKKSVALVLALNTFGNFERFFAFLFFTALLLIPGHASVSMRGAGAKMSKMEALKILDIKPAASLEEAAQYMTANDPAKGGSFYIQSKVYRAFECLQHEQQKAAGGGAKTPPKASSSTSGSKPEDPANSA